MRFAALLALVLGTSAVADPPLGAPTTHPTTRRSVTFGIESEFKPQGQSQGLVDEGTMQVDLRRVPFAFRRATREDRRGANSTNNLEINGLPVGSLDESMTQMRDILRQQGVDPMKLPPPKSETGARSLHLHIFIPVEFFESLPEKERTAAVAAFSARMSDVLMSRRLAVDPYLALSTESVGWLSPKFSDQRGATRFIDRQDIGVYDIEIRGTRIDLALMEELAREVVKVAREPKRIADPPTDLQTALHLESQTLPEFLETYGQKIPDADAKLLRFLRSATKGMGHDLPLYRFDEVPLFAKQKSVIAAANETFARDVKALLEMIRGERQPLSAAAERRFIIEYQTLIQRWGAAVKLTELLGPKYLFPDPKDLPSKAAQREFLTSRALKAVETAEYYGELGRQSIALDALAGSKELRAHRRLVEYALHGPNEVFRVGSAKLLHGASTDLLVRVIENTTGKVRDGAIESLAKSDNADRFAHLLPVLTEWNPDHEMRMGVLNALRGIEGPGVVEALVQTALIGGDSVPIRNARQAAFSALAMRSDATSLAALKSGLRSSMHSVSAAAAGAFDGRRDVEAVEFVVKFLEANPTSIHFYEIIKGLRLNPNTDAVRNLYRAAMLSSNEGARRGVAAALPFRTEPWAIDFMRTVARDPNPEVRRELMKRLADRYLDPKAVDILRIGLQDSEESVRRFALETLAARTDPASVALLREVVVEQRGLMANNSMRPSLGPRFTDEQARYYIDVLRAGHSLHGLCIDTLEILGGF